VTAAPRIAVLDYGIGNLRSAEKALQHVGAAARLVDDAADVAAADAVVLPGVGAFGACARALHESGLEDAARGAIAAGVPFFGVCVGFQLLYEGSVESPGAVGLGVFPGAVAPLPAGVKHPQMQWNTLQVRGVENADGAAGDEDPVPEPLRGLGPRPWVYFVHSFAPPVGAETTAVCDYGGEVAALATRGALWGAQFHPEKSGATGLALLGNFVRCAQAAA
jgi:imidazole glycerol-phosphate synthase subunit HisH